MDSEEMRAAFNRAVGEGWDPPTIWKEIDETPIPETDYAIVRMSPDRYIIASSRFLGSLDYEFVAECNNHWDARQIVKALSQ